MPFYNNNNNYNKMSLQITIDTIELVNAAGRGDLIKVTSLLQDGANPNYQNSNGDTSLMVAIDKNYEEIALSLICAKTDLNIQDKGFNNTALLKCKNVRILRALIDADADINIQNRSGDTLLMFACVDDNLEIVEALVELGADLTIYNCDGNTAFLDACDNEHLRIVQYLINAGADNNLRDGSGNTALILACLNGHWPVAQELIDAGVPWIKLGAMFKVSDNAVRKWAKKYSLI